MPQTVELAPDILATYQTVEEQRGVSGFFGHHPEFTKSHDQGMAAANILRGTADPHRDKNGSIFPFVVDITPDEESGEIDSLELYGFTRGVHFVVHRDPLLESRTPVRSLYLPVEIRWASVRDSDRLLIAGTYTFNEAAELGYLQHLEGTPIMEKLGLVAVFSFIGIDEEPDFGPAFNPAVQLDDEAEPEDEGVLGLYLG